ncbi:MAG: cyclic pyranopterin monophosphate synthase MoaC [Actinomycetota bacterium]|nr:cyclic pyranopterin monophosphate synthase MoaC [Actinomycetota bacterium]
MGGTWAWGCLVEKGVDDAGTSTSSDSPTRRAVVRGRITMQEETVASVAANSLKKGDVLGTARYAGVQAAKEASSLLPLTTSIRVRSTSIEFLLGENTIDVEAVVECLDAHESPMPAFSAATVAVLTIYDMCKSADHTMVIGPVELLER